MRARAVRRRALLAILDRDRAASVEDDALRQRRGLDVQVLAALGGAKIRHRGARPSAVTRRGLEEAGAFLRGAVEIGIFRQADLRGGLDEGRRQRIGMTELGDRQRAADAMEIVGAAHLVLGLLEIGQHVVKAPALIAALAPAVVILVLAADVEQAVDRTRSAQHLAARLKHLPPVEARLRLGLVHPVDGLFLEQPAIAERHVDPEVGILWARLEQQHRILAVRAQAVGEHAAGRACADDDVVEFACAVIGTHQRPAMHHGGSRKWRETVGPVSDSM